MSKSQNGWNAGPKTEIDIVSPKVPGTNVDFPQGVLAGDVEVVLMYVAEQFHLTVEPLVDGHCWGYFYKNIEGSDDLSNHASGTAIDLNAPAHPMGKENTFSAAQRKAIRKILDYCEGVVRWGGDYQTRKDDMHFEINAGHDAVHKIANKIREAKGDAPAPAPVQPKVYHLGDRVLKVGMEGSDVREAQDRLNRHGARLVEDGDFGGATEGAVKEFQRRKRLLVDGVVGPKTAAALKAAPVELLKEDGELGAKTIARWQEVMGTTVDGKITEPSELVRAVQRHLKAKVDRHLVVDGEGIRQDGRKYKTVTALQRYLGTPVDGIMSRPTSVVVKALQRRLNEGRF